MKHDKILFFVDKVSYSGASKIISWLVNNLEMENTEIFLATYNSCDDAREIKEGVKRIRLNVFGRGRILKGISIVSALRKAINEKKFDLCVGFLPTECLYLQLALLGKRIPVVVCERSDPYMEKSMIATIGRFFFRFASGAVFQTEGAKAFFPLSLQRRSVVIPNPVFQIDVPFIPYDLRENVIACSGRLYIQQKRQDVLLRAFADVCKHNDQIQLVIYGDGPDEDALRAITAELGITHRVVFAGKVVHIEEKLSHCKLFVFTSDYEGIPNSILEALQVGVPVVSTDCSPGGARLLIQDGENGYVVPREDVNGLAHKIMYMLDHPEHAGSCARKARKVSEIYAEEVILGKWESYFQSMKRN